MGPQQIMNKKEQKQKYLQFMAHSIPLGSVW